jgi:putative ABC transport system substrate-binding protein
VLRATSTIPVIFAGVSDPVAQGYVSNLAQPGRNVTGFTLFEFSMAGKWLGMLQEIAPRTKRVAVIYHPDIAPSGPLYMRAIESVAKAFAVELVSAPVRDEAELEHAIVSVGREVL